MPHQGKENQRSCWPEDVGIVAIEIYFPSRYVDQTELEQYDGVSAGKYTIGLGQNKMGICSDREDINSLCLTVVERLMEKHHVGYENIGRLEVGTETLLDKSKSVKTVLMQLFEGSGNQDVEGIDTTNACYGGTAALLNAIGWVESSAWDGRYALVVCGDIAVYASGSARPTGGAGAVAMLIGPHAPLVIERGTRCSHMQHTYDFYKPDMESEYPRVDGKLSIQCYLAALDRCYQGFCRKTEARAAAQGIKEKVTLDKFDGLLFHSPYCKLVQKSLARLVYNDLMRTQDGEELKRRFPGMDKFRKARMEDTYEDRDLEKAMVTFSAPTFQGKTHPSLLLANQVGNMYTASLYGSLIAYLISKPAHSLSGNRMTMFSYGSGLAATMFAIRVSAESGPNSALSHMCQSLADVKRRLETRSKMTPDDFSTMMQQKEDVLHKVPYKPSAPTCELFPGTWYLTNVDSEHRRTYECTPHDAMNGAKYELKTSVQLASNGNNNKGANLVGVGIQTASRLVANSS